MVVPSNAHELGIYQVSYINEEGKTMTQSNTLTFIWEEQNLVMITTDMKIITL